MTAFLHLELPKSSLGLPHLLLIVPGCRESNLEHEPSPAGTWAAGWRWAPWLCQGLPPQSGTVGPGPTTMPRFDPVALCSVELVCHGTCPKWDQQAIARYSTAGFLNPLHPGSCPTVPQPLQWGVAEGYKFLLVTWVWFSMFCNVRHYCPEP